MVEIPKIELDSSQVKDRSLSTKSLMRMLGVEDEEQLLAEFAKMDKEIAKKWFFKLDFFGQASLKVSFDAIERGKANPVVENGDGVIDGIVAGLGLTAGAATAEVVKRFKELLLGNEQVYRAHLDHEVLLEKFAFALQGKGIEVEIMPGSDDFVFKDRHGTELLRIYLRNVADEKAPNHLQPYATVLLGEEELRKMPRCEVGITGTDGGSLVKKGLDLVDRFTKTAGAVSQLQATGNVDAVLNAGGKLWESSKEAASLVGLTQLLIIEIEKLAKTQEGLFRSENERIQQENQIRFDQVKEALYCDFCKRLKADCTCGASVTNEKPTDELLEEQRRLEMVGFNFQAS